MAVAATSPATVRALTVGVCAPAEIASSEIRAVLAHAGHTIDFWHADPTEAIDACTEGEIEMLLVGARRPDSRSLKLVGEISEKCEGVKAILICEQVGDGNVRKALDAGARGLVALSEVDTALPAVMDVVQAGQTSVPSARSPELRKQILTAREKQILGLVVMGMTNAEIAAKLFLAESTVKSHLSSAFAKLGVASRSEAAAVILDSQSGLGLGILTIPSN